MIDNLSQLHEQLLVFQRRMRWLRVHIPFRLDAITSNLLPVIATRSSFYSRDLCEFLKASPTQVSRLVAKFEKLGLLARVRVDKDARLKALVLSARGLATLSEIVAHDKTLADLGLAALNEAQREKLSEQFGALSDGFGAAPDTALPHEPAFVTEQKRLARVLGMLGNNYLMSGLDIAAYQLCFHLSRCVVAVRFRDLKQELPFETSFLSREIDRFVNKGWLSKNGHPSSNRAVYVEMTTLGLRQFTAIHEASSAMIQKAIETAPPCSADLLCNLLKIANSGPLTIEDDPKLRLVRCRSEKDFQSARSHIVEWLVATDQHRNMPAVLVGENQRCYQVLREKVVSGVAVVMSRGKDRSELIRLDILPGYNLSGNQTVLVLNELVAQERVSQIEIQKSLCNSCQNVMNGLKTNKAGQIIYKRQ